ncbi:MAG: shikimate kinase [Bacteroidales bacterium]
MTVFLIGFMGSGKTTVGRKLASKLNMQSVDLDDKIEEETGMTIEQIFNTKGEEYFRDIENKCLKKVIKQKNLILSTGGGTPCYMDNMRFMNQQGVTVYIKMNSYELYSRLIYSKTNRPLLKNKEKAEMKQFIQNKLTERKPYYEKAQLIVKGLNINVGELAEQIKKKMQ